MRQLIKAALLLVLSSAAFNASAVIMVYTFGGYVVTGVDTVTDFTVQLRVNAPSLASQTFGPGSPGVTHFSITFSDDLADGTIANLDPGGLTSLTPHTVGGNVDLTGTQITTNGAGNILDGSFAPFQPFLINWSNAIGGGDDLGTLTGFNNLGQGNLSATTENGTANNQIVQLSSYSTNCEVGPCDTPQQEIPEPGAILGVLLSGAGIWAIRRRRQHVA